MALLHAGLGRGGDIDGTWKLFPRGLVGQSCVSLRETCGDVRIRGCAFAGGCGEGAGGCGSTQKRI